MHRWTSFRCLLATAALQMLSASLLMPAAVRGESDGGTLGANHEISIESSQAAARPSESATGMMPDADAVSAPDLSPHTDDNERPRVADVDSVEQEKQPLVDAPHEKHGDLTQRMMDKQSGPASEFGEQSLGLMKSNNGDRAESRFGIIPGIDNDFIQVFGALAIVIGLLIAFRFVMIRASGALAGSRPSGVLEVLARYPVARGQHMALIKLGRRILLVHQNGSAMSTLSEVSDPNEVAALLSRIEAGSSGRDADRFRSLLTQYQREHEMISRHAGTTPSEMPETGRRPQTDQGEVIDLTRSQMGGLRTLFGGNR